MHSNSFKALPLIVAACVAACARDATPTAKNAPIPDPIAVVVIENLIPIGKGSTDLIYCLRIDGKDANPEVLQALQTTNLKVVPASQCEFTQDDEISVHRPSRNRASFISLENYSTYGETSAEIDGATFTGKLSGSIVRFDLHLNSGKWQVVGQTPTGAM